MIYRVELVIFMVAPAPFGHGKPYSIMDKHVIKVRTTERRWVARFWYVWWNLGQRHLPGGRIMGATMSQKESVT